jgi:hypothetical protein
MSRNKCFPSFEYHMFYVLYPFVIYSLTLPRIYIYKNISITVRHLQKNNKVEQEKTLTNKLTFHLFSSVDIVTKIRAG